MRVEGVATEHIPDDRVRGPAVGWGQEDPEWLREQASYSGGRTGTSFAASIKTRDCHENASLIIFVGFLYGNLISYSRVSIDAAKLVPVRQGETYMYSFFTYATVVPVVGVEKEGQHPLEKPLWDSIRFLY